jgi:hypothetical protein
MNLKTMGAGIAALALMLALATSAQASLVIEQNGPVQIGDSWIVPWLATGVTFDEIIGTVLQGDQFEIPGLTASGWTSSPSTPVGGLTSTASINGPATSLLDYNSTFTGGTADQPPVLINFQVLDAGNLVGNETLLWNGSEFDVVPEPTTMIAGASLLLPLGASTLRILRRNRMS